MFKSIEITHEIRKPRNPSLKDLPATFNPYPPRQPRKLYRASRFSKNYFYCNRRISSYISINHLSPFFLFFVRKYFLLPLQLDLQVFALGDFGNPRERRSRECPTYLIDKFFGSSVLAIRICRGRFGFSPR